MPDPPEAAELILCGLVPLDMRETVSGDLLEEYRESPVPAVGEFRAGLWYWRQVGGMWLRACWWLVAGEILFPPAGRKGRRIISGVLLAIGAASTIAIPAGVFAQETASAPSVVLLQIPVSYPPIAESARVTGKVEVRVGVRPDGTVAEVTMFPQPGATAVRLLSGPAVDAAARATFECRRCTQPVTPHMLTFVFVLDGTEDEGKLLPPAWRQTGDASSEVTVHGRTLICDHCPRSEPPRKRAVRCLWLWRCST